MRNVTALQADCSLTYTGNNIYLTTSFCHALLQGHILAIPEPGVLTESSPLLTPPYSAAPANAQQQAMRIQVLLSMGQDRFIKRRSAKATGTECPCPRVHTRAASFDTKLHEVSGGLPEREEPDMFVDGDVAASH